MQEHGPRAMDGMWKGGRPRVTAWVGATVQIVGLESVAWRVTYVNAGRRRVVLEPVDPAVIVREADRDRLVLPASVMPPELGG